MWLPYLSILLEEQYVSAIHLVRVGPSKTIPDRVLAQFG